VENNNYTVYMHINKINNKKYIGITQQKLKKRWGNGNGYKNNIYFWRAIKKYGWDNFEHIVLFKNINELTAKETEKYLIQKYNTYDANYGYNISLGGDGTYGYHHTDETKEKIRIKSSQHRHTDETKDILSKMSSVKVIQFSKNNNCLIKIFNSIILAEKETGISSKHISRCCNKQRKSAGGFYWMFYNDYINNGFDKNLLNNDNCRKVICLDTNKIFNSIKEASVIKQIHNVSIFNCCKGLSKTAGGFKWMYKEDYDNMLNNQLAIN
jgi:hypothetical protein